MTVLLLSSNFEDHQKGQNISKFYFLLIFLDDFYSLWMLGFSIILTTTWREQNRLTKTRTVLYTRAESSADRFTIRNRAVVQPQPDRRYLQCKRMVSFRAATNTNLVMIDTMNPFLCSIANFNSSFNFI